ncbi:MAG: DUF4168 domain-containing protein [Leptolyngbya sp. SIO4C1]|nr:DUF4168 domain-containing protein [Leptolyngbya sp. SIO4C1]
MRLYSLIGYRQLWSVRSMLIGLSAAMTWAISLQPEPSVRAWQPVSLDFAAAYAQTVTNEEVRSYAEAVLSMENNRIEAYTQISDILTSAGFDVTEYRLSCPNAPSLTDVPRRVRSRVQPILVDYCNAAREIVETSGLTVDRFNDITTAHRNDSDLTERIQLEIAAIRQP